MSSIITAPFQHKGQRGENYSAEQSGPGRMPFICGEVQRWTREERDKRRKEDKTRRRRGLYIQDKCVFGLSCHFISCFIL